MKVTQSLITASDIIKNGGVIAYPTEGIWGIGGLNTSEIQQKIYLAKKRDDSKKFILLQTSTLEPQIKNLVQKEKDILSIGFIW